MDGVRKERRGPDSKLLANRVPFSPEVSCDPNGVM